jgi:hypothetical protein
MRDIPNSFGVIKTYCDVLLGNTPPPRVGIDGGEKGVWDGCY